MKLSKEIEHSVTAAKLEFDKEPMDDYYNNKIAGYPSRLRVKKVVNELGNLRGKSVLDIGCEAGYVASKIIQRNKPAEFYGIDIFEEVIEKCKERLSPWKNKVKIVIKKAFLQKMPFKNNLFDAIVCTEVIEHAPDIDRGFKEMHRVMKKGGRLIITFPNEKLRKMVYPIVKLLGVNTDVEEHVTLFDYDSREILKKLSRHFKIRKYYRFPFYFPMTNFVVCEKQ